MKQSSIRQSNPSNLVSVTIRQVAAKSKKRSSSLNRPTSYMTKDGLVSIQLRIRTLQEQRATISQLLTYTRDLEGSDESSHYDALLTEQEYIEQRISYLKKTLDSAKLITKIDGATTVQIGSTVTVQTDEVCQRLTIVGNTEVNLQKGFISNESPVGKALIGKQVGEMVEITTPMRSISYQVKGIS
jgi:transcription elongation factor GreA